MTEHSGLIANRPHKGDESFLLRLKIPALVLRTESDSHDDADESDHIIFTMDPVGSKEEYTPYIEFKSLKHTVFQLQRTMQTLYGNLDTIKANKLRN